MFINEKKNAIELSKKEAKAAAKFGTTEYKQLQEARRDYHTKKEYKDAWRLVESTEDKLKEQLSFEDFELFTQYQEAEARAGDIEDADIFIEGFRMGAKVILDILLKDIQKSA